jgi:hypothetical protein
MANNDAYDFSWDEVNDELWDKKYVEWKNRNWKDWLSKNLSFPFEVERKEDLDREPFLSNKNEPFRACHQLVV